MAPFESPLTSLPVEILDHIAFYLAANHVGLLGQLLPLLCTSKRFFRQLSQPNNPALYARIFKHKFDSRAIQRRAFSPTSSEYAEQLVSYCRVLRTVQRGLFDNSAEDDDENVYDIDTVLLVMHLMLLEDDGSNSAQLHAVDAYYWVKKIVVSRLHDNAQNGWPLDCLRNSLAVWNMWMLTKAEFLQEETEEENDQIRTLLLPFVSFAPRYPAAFVPASHFHLPIKTVSSSHPPPTSFPTSHGAYPPYFLSSSAIAFHYRLDFQFHCPPVAPAAKLLYFARKERYPFDVAPTMPSNRAESIQQALEIGDPTKDGTRTITKADIEEWNGQGSQIHPAFPGGTVLPPLKDRHDGVEWSKAWDVDFNRLRMCTNVQGETRGGALRIRPGLAHIPGSISGLWAGQMAWSDHDRLQTLFFPYGVAQPPLPAGIDGVASSSPPTLPPTFSEEYLTLRAGAVYMRLQESVVYAPGPVIPCGGPNPITDDESEDVPVRKHSLAKDQRHAFDQGLLEGWFPRGMGWKRVIDYRYDIGRAVSTPPPDATAMLTTSFGVGAEAVPFAQETVHVSFDYRQADPNWEGMMNTFVYQTIKPLPLTKELSVPLKANPPLTLPMQSRYSSLAGALGTPIPSVPIQPPLPPGSKLIDCTVPCIYPKDPGRFHDHYTCAGCIAREAKARKCRMPDVHEGETENEDSESDDPAEEDVDADEELWHDTGLARQPSHDPSVISDCPGVIDIILTGSTDPRHGAAWNPYIYTGRVRLYDGLIGILRTPAKELDNSQSNANIGGETVASLGRVVFYGYLVGGRNFVGNYRVVGTGDVRSPGWEGAFSLGRRE